MFRLPLRTFLSRARTVAALYGRPGRAKHGRSLRLMTAAASVVLLAQCANFPSVDHLTAGELLTESRDLPPAGVDLRPMYSKGISVTKESEGWEPELYNDVANFCTIGYGHLVKKAPCNGTEPDEFQQGLTETQGTTLLVGDMASAQYTVMKHVKTPMNDGQFAALTDFVFNVGSANFRSSTLLKVVNENKDEQVSVQFRRWVLANGKTWPGLVKRREKEISLYFDGRPVPREVPLPEEAAPIDVRTGE